MVLLAKLKRGGSRPIDLVLDQDEVRMGYRFWSASEFLFALERAKAGKSTKIATENFTPYVEGIRIYPYKLTWEQAEDAISALKAAQITPAIAKPIHSKYKLSIGGGVRYNPL